MEVSHNLATRDVDSMTSSTAVAANPECAGLVSTHGLEYAKINAGTQPKENPVTAVDYISQKESGFGDNLMSVGQLAKEDNNSSPVSVCYRNKMVPQQNCRSQPFVYLAIAKGANHHAPSSSRVDCEDKSDLRNVLRKSSLEMVEIFSTAETSCLGGRPPLAPSRLRKMQLSGSRSFGMI